MHNLQASFLAIQLCFITNWLSCTRWLKVWKTVLNDQVKLIPHTSQNLMETCHKMPSKITNSMTRNTNHSLRETWIQISFKPWFSKMMRTIKDNIIMFIWIAYLQNNNLGEKRAWGKQFWMKKCADVHFPNSTIIWSLNGNIYTCFMQNCKI